VACVEAEQGRCASDAPRATLAPYSLLGGAGVAATVPGKTPRAGALDRRSMATAEACRGAERGSQEAVTL
jgi:hypothetical protein